MNSEHAKWIELWLDSVNERAYQNAFVSALAHHGYSILHNTSHTPLELGKDVVARDASGNLYAFQLKGNPGSRLTISQWQDIAPQIFQLVNLPVPRLLTRNKSEAHFPVLVTNGEVDENTRSAIELFNNQNVPSTPNARPLQTWTRGKLLTILTEAADAAWPGGLDAHILLLRLLSSTGRDPHKADDIQRIAQSALDWDRRPSRPGAVEKLCAAQVLFSICQSKFIECGNYFEAIRLGVIFFCYLSCYAAKYNVRNRRVKVLMQSIKQTLRQQVDTYSHWIMDVYGDRPFVVRSPLSEFAIIHPRRMLVSAIVAANVLWEVEEGKEPDQESNWSFFHRRIDYPFLVYEGMIPAFLPVFWAKDILVGNRRSEDELTLVMRNILQLHSKRSDTDKLPAPFYELPDVVKWKYKLHLGMARSRIDGDSCFQRSWFVLPIVQILGRRNYKTTVKMAWPDVTRFLHISSELDDVTEFAFHQASSATEIARRVEGTSWASFVQSVTAEPQIRLPATLIEEPILVMLFCLFVPHRMTPAIAMWLDRKFCRAWY